MRYHGRSPLEETTMRTLALLTLFATGCASRQALTPPLADGSSASAPNAQQGKADNGKPCPKAAAEAAAAKPSGG
jgi:hypothetical protein